jgi:hypothetical protein
LLFTVTSTNRFYSPLPLEQERFDCNVNIEYGNLRHPINLNKIVGL